MVMVPKGPRANVRDIESAPSSRPRGRPSGLGYDPEASEEYATETLERHGSDPETDVFSLVGKRGYSEDRFYTRSTDAQGHGEHLRVRMPQGIEAQVYGAVREVSEYRTVQDLMRDAVVHRLEYLQKRYKMSDEARRLLELERLRADSDRRSQDIDTMTDAVVDLGEKLSKAWEAKDYAMVAEELEEGSELIDWLREPYRGQVKQLLADWRARSKEAIDARQKQQEE